MDFFFTQQKNGAEGFITTGTTGYIIQGSKR